MPYNDVLVHTGRQVRTEATGPKVDGRPVVADELGTPFDCCLFLPAPGGDQAERSGRRVRRPTLLLAARDRAGEPLELSGEDRLEVTAPELTGPNPVVWQLTGEPQPFGKPGRAVIGSQAALRRVED